MQRGQAWYHGRGGENLSTHTPRLVLALATLLGLTAGCAEQLVFVPEDRGDRSPHPEEGWEAPDPMTLGDHLADARFVSESTYQHVGWTVAGAGDVNGDGYDDIVVGAPGDNEGGEDLYYPFFTAGAAHLLLGPLSGEVPLADATATFVGEAGLNMAGSFAAPAGDLDGDGRDQFVVGNMGAYFANDESHGKAYVLDGSYEGSVELTEVSPAIVGETTSMFAGASVASAGDVDGDGQIDLLVGDVADAAMGERTGAAYVLLGPILGDVLLADADAKLTGEAEFDDAGWALDAAGDVDDDGFGDFLVGAPNDQAQGPGHAYLVHGPVSGVSSLAEAPVTFAGEAEGDQAGASVAGGDDLDGDGHADFVIGAPSAGARSSDDGTVYVIFGPVAGDVALSNADAVLRAEGTSEELGSSVALCGDVSGDGVGDLLVAERASVYLVTQPLAGQVGLSHVGHRFPTHGAIDLMSQAVAGAGDVNADGVGDFLIGVPFDSSDHFGGGTAYLFLGGAEFD